MPPRIIPAPAGMLTDFYVVRLLSRIRPTLAAGQDSAHRTIRLASRFITAEAVVAAAAASMI
ncbi:MAG: hypothetical protein JWL81_2987 [Verrucomicrobiales bacterium]|nr:hypothetical protein [Verrucomicrobiales bacterium]